VPREPWYESDNPSRVARGFSWRAALAIVAVVLFVGAIGIGIWAFQVGTADVKGRGDTVRKVNQVDNRLFAQGNFNDLYQEVMASDRKLDQAAADKAAHPQDPFFDTTYTGLRAHCEDARAQYNSAARKISQAKFRDADLPYQVDDSDPKTDCKESQK
jgi:hypothetical protein